MATIVILLLIGAVLLASETLLPGLIAGTIGLCCLIAAVIKGYTEFGVSTGNTLLKGQIGSIGTERPCLLHQTGTAMTSLRPSGMAMINEERVDVVTEGQMIERGTPVKVVAIEGMRVIVRTLS